jgi:vacuolar-type H+-ATPase subunit I/STV1
MSVHRGAGQGFEESRGGSFVETRAEYIAKVTAQLTEWDAQLARLKEKVATAPAPQRVEFLSSIELLELRRKEAEERLNELTEEGEGRESAMDEIWDDLKESIRKVVVKL